MYIYKSWYKLFISRKLKYKQTFAIVHSFTVKCLTCHMSSAVNKFWSRHPHWESRWQPTFRAPKARAFLGGLGACPQQKILKFRCLEMLFSTRLLARILKVGVQILCGPKAHIEWRLWRHAPRGFGGHAPPENFEKLKPPRRDFRDSDSCWKAHTVALPLPHFHCHLHCHFH